MFGNNDETGAPAHDDGNQPVNDNDAGAPSDNGATDNDNGDMQTPSYDAPQAQDSPAPSAGPSDDVLPNDHADKDDLLSLKQQALQQLSPLVSHLDQSPEEKFRTTMMMIQAADNAALLKEAYEAAQAIPDEKVKAQALLDVINEINYFTQQHDEQ